MNNNGFYNTESLELESGFEMPSQYEEEFRQFRARPTKFQRPQPSFTRSQKRFQRPIPRRVSPARSINYGPSFTIPEPQLQGTEYVRWVQTMLNQVLNLQLSVDGVMSVQTRSAIRSFQEKNSLPVTGIVGPDTERAIIAAGSGQSSISSSGISNEPSVSQPGTGTTPSAEPPPSSPNSEFEFEWESEINRNSHDYIKWVQQSLNQTMGLRLAVDGAIGTQTRSAIRSFQQRAGLSPDGVVGPKTEAALCAAGAASPPSEPSAPLAAVTAPDIVKVRGIQVSSQIASQVEALLTAAAADGISLAGWGYRSTARQIELRRKHCGPTQYDIWQKPSSQCNPPTATPGRSMHEKGLAIDFTYNGRGIGSHDNTGYQWLAKNAARFGLKNLPSEPWHWSVNGK